MSIKDVNNALEEMELRAKRLDIEEKAAKEMARARAKLVLGKDAVHAFFASLAMRLKPVINWTMPTAATDGKHLFYNPEFWLSLSMDEQKGVVSHEVLHCSNKHLTRREWRAPNKANIAMDLSINPIVLNDCKLHLPKGRLMPGEGIFKGLPVGQSFEWYYANLPKPPNNPASPPNDKGKTKGKGGAKDNSQPDYGDPNNPDPGGCGGVIEPKGDLSPAKIREIEEEWKIAVAQARQSARMRGTVPAGIDRLVDGLLAPQRDWRRELEDFITSKAKNDYQWSPPNRRFIHAGLYLPGMKSDEIGEVVCWFDTSGSISVDDMRVFGGELTGILAVYPGVQLTIVYCDAQVHHVQRWSPNDGPLVLEPKGGGGGTNTLPFFKWIEDEQLEPSVVVCLTDLCCNFPYPEPLWPTIWCVIGPNKNEPPFGRRINVKTENRNDSRH